MTEEYYEKHQMEEDLGVDVEPYTPEEIDEMYEDLLKKSLLPREVK